jgi:D-methionine transport system ATP-binding protein
MIRLEHVSKRFETGKQTVEAVKDVTLHIEKGEIAGIIGFSGAGKSTLARCINLLERPTEGSVTVGGAELTALNEKQLREKRKKIGMIFQQFNLFASRTVYGNVAYPLRGRGKREIDEKVRSLLDLVGLADKADAYPSQLSGGQKQRVAIARALASDPEVLLSDEATSALDPETTQSILRLLKEVNRALGVTILIITHEMQVIKEICSQVYVMEGGRIVEQGDVFQVFAVPRQAVTRRFVDSTSHLSRIQELLDDPARPIKLNPGDYLFRLNYLERSTSEALISNISRRFELDVNILLGSIELIDGNPLGGLVVVAGGGHDKIAAAAEYLSKRNVQVEVISHG